MSRDATWLCRGHVGSHNLAFHGDANVLSLMPRVGHMVYGHTNVVIAFLEITDGQIAYLQSVA